MQHEEVMHKADETRSTCRSKFRSTTAWLRFIRVKTHAQMWNGGVGSAERRVGALLPDGVAARRSWRLETRRPARSVGASVGTLGNKVTARLHGPPNAVLPGKLPNCEGHASGLCTAKPQCQALMAPWLLHAKTPARPNHTPRPQSTTRGCSTSPGMPLMPPKPHPSPPATATAPASPDPSAAPRCPCTPACPVYGRRGDAGSTPSGPSQSSGAPTADAEI